MSKRSNWCEFSKETREYIKNRERGCCIICGSTNELTIAHIFLSRAKGGAGVKENGVLICRKDHYFLLDNPLGKKNNELSKKYKERLKTYLITKENINYNNDFIENLKYHK